MNDMNEQQQPATRTSDVCDRVLRRIEGEGIEPKSKWLILCENGSIRLLWLVSIVVGAVAVAVSLFSLIHSGYAFYEATHNNAYTLLVETLPYLWLFILALTLLVAVHHFRRIGRGYRYSLSAVVGTSVLFSLFGGVLLHTLSVGQLVDTKLAEAMPMYRSQEARELALWQRPEEGRLVGVLVNDAPRGSNTALFRDVDGTDWMVVTIDLHEEDMKLLNSQNEVRLLGVVLHPSDPQLHVCGVFPWMYDDDFSLSDISTERRSFIERMYAHKEYARERVAAIENKLLSGTVPTTFCANLEAVRRIGRGM